MNRVVFPMEARAVIKQSPFTKLDFLKARVVMRLLVLVAFLVTLSIFYIWSRVQVVQLGYEINAHKEEQMRLEDASKKLKLEYTLMRSPKQVTQRAGSLKFLDYPGPERTAEIGE